MSSDASFKVDDAFYAANYTAELHGRAPAEHFESIGRIQGLQPNAEVDPSLDGFRDFVGDAGQPLPRQYGALCRAIIRHFPKVEYDGYFWNFLETHKPADPGSSQPYDDNLLRAPETAGRMGFEFAGTRREIRQPTTASFLDIVARADEPVFHTRLPHNFWDGLARVFILNRILSERFPGRTLSTDASFRLAIRLARRLRPNDPQSIIFIENFIPELAALARNLPDNRQAALALKSFPDGGTGLFGNCDVQPPRAPYIFEAVTRLFPECTQFGDAMLMKRFVMTGEFDRFIEVIRARPVVLVANALFSDFGERFRLPSSFFVEVPPRESHRIREEVIDRCRQAIVSIRQSAPRSVPPIMLTRCGGSFSFLLLSRLRAEFPEVSFIDLGQSINLWFLDRDGVIPKGTLRLTPGLAKQIALNRLTDFYRSHSSIGDISSFIIDRHGEAPSVRSWSTSSRFLQYAQLCAQFGLRDETALFIDRARSETPNDPALMDFIEQHKSQ